MPHKVGKKGDVVEFFKEILCKTVSKRVGIYYSRIESIFQCVVFELLCDTS